MFQPIDPIEQRKQALIQHLVGQAGMAGGGRPVGTLMGRPFGSFVRSGVDPLLHMLASNPNQNFTGINPAQAAAAAAMSGQFGPQMGPGPMPVGVGGPDPFSGGVTPGDFFHPTNNLPSILANYGGHYGQ